MKRAPYPSLAILLTAMMASCGMFRGQIVGPEPSVEGGGAGGAGSGEGGNTGTGGMVNGGGGSDPTGGRGGDESGGSGNTGGFGGMGMTATGGGPGGAGGGAQAGATGAKGVWENVTPAGLNLKAGTSGNPGFGAQEILADPLKPGVFYAFADFVGMWRSTDWGLTWTKVSRDGNLEKGKTWGEAIAQDASYMLASTGNANGGAWRSTDGGATWTPNLIGGGNDPYMYDIDKADKNHVITSMHGEDNIYESRDGGRTWTNRGPVPGGTSGYVFFINPTTWLMVAQSGGNAGTRRTTNSGGSWSQVGPMAHFHGNEQIYIDPTTKAIYVPGEGGIWRSTNDGQSFTKISDTHSSAVFGTETRLYSMNSGATGGFNDPHYQSASRSNGTDWAKGTVPAGMTNGCRKAAVSFDKSTNKWIILCANWLAGMWRMVE